MRRFGFGMGLAMVGAVVLVAAPLGCKKGAKPPERTGNDEEPDAGAGPAQNTGPTKLVETADGAVLAIVEPGGDADLLHPPKEVTPERAEFACPGQEEFEASVPDPQPDFDMDDLRALFPDLAPDKVPVEINTEEGKIQCEVWPQQAPRAAAIFLGLATGARAWWHPCKHEWVVGQPYYDETSFHDVAPAEKIEAGCLYRGCEAGAGFPAAISDGGAAFDRPGLLVMRRDGPAGVFGILDCAWTPPEPTKITEGACEFRPEARALQSDWVAFGLCQHEGLASTVYRLARVAPDRHLDPRALHWLRAVSPTTEYYRYRPAGETADGGTAPAADAGAAAVPTVVTGTAVPPTGDAGGEPPAPAPAVP